MGDRAAVGRPAEPAARARAVSPGPDGGARPVGVFVGLATLDVVHRVERTAGPDEKVTATRQDVAAGGPALGAALVFAALGGRAALVTGLGADAAGAAVRADLERCGVSLVDAGAGLPGAERPATPVSAVRVLAATGERSVTSVDAAAASVPAPAGLADLVAGADVVLLDGHHAGLASATARAVAGLRAAGERAPVVVLDAGRWRPVVDGLLDVVDAVIASAAFRTSGAHDPAETAAGLRERGVPMVATTDGAGPVRWSAPTGGGVVDVPAVDVRDTLGAGDALHGGAAWALAQGWPLEEALRLGVAVAGARVVCAGAGDWLALLARGGLAGAEGLLGGAGPSLDRE